MKTKAICLSEFNEKINILQAQQTKDEIGGMIKQWDSPSKSNQLWASIQPIAKTYYSDGDFIKSGLTFAKDSIYEVTIRFRKCDYLRNDTRIHWKGEDYAVTSLPRILGKRQWIKFLISKSNNKNSTSK